MPTPPTVEPGYYASIDPNTSIGPTGVDISWTWSSLPDVPTLTSPANSATSVALNPTFTWQVSSGADTYEVQLSTDSGFATTVFDTSAIATTSYASPVVLTPSTVYYWRARATNGTGSSAWASAFSFTTTSTVAAVTVSGASNNGPIQITTLSAHGLITGQAIYISGSVGNTNVNGYWIITVTSTTTFTLDGSVGNGTWTSGGTIWDASGGSGGGGGGGSTGAVGLKYR